LPHATLAQSVLVEGHERRNHTSLQRLLDLWLIGVRTNSRVKYLSCVAAVAALTLALSGALCVPNLTKETSDLPRDH
jgi:hypothetical protein